MRKDLKQILDIFYDEYNFAERLKHDPIEFPHRYTKKSDIEVTGFITSCFSYGKVDLFKSVIEKVLSAMGSAPYDFLLDFDVRKHQKLFNGISYRFNQASDILGLMLMLSRLLKKYHSIELAFQKCYSQDDINIKNGLTGLIKLLFYTNTSDIYGKNIKPPGLRQLLPSPENGSACKRSNLFLRWMIRKKDIDFGIWHEIPEDKLIIPLDIHIARISRCLGFTTRKSNDWKTAEEITEALKRFNSDDPLKYDFALCHHGISGLCRGIREGTSCNGCIFGSVL